MEANEHNYGVVGEHETAAMGAQDERPWSARTHLSRCSDGV